MGFRDRFFTPKTAKAIMSWRLPLGIAVAVAMTVVGVPVAGSIGVGIGLYAALVERAMPRTPRRPPIDAFAVGEPWRQFVQAAQRSRTKLRDTLDSTDEGPLRDRLLTIADRLDDGLDETWLIAQRGDKIDDAVRRLDPVALRSKLGSLQAREHTPELATAIASVEQQLAAVDRLKHQSEQTANTLRLSQVRHDELVSRSAEIAIGTSDVTAYERDVEDLVIELEALHQAVLETRDTETGTTETGPTETGSA